MFFYEQPVEVLELLCQVDEFLCRNLSNHLPRSTVHDLHDHAVEIGIDRYLQLISSLAQLLRNGLNRMNDFIMGCRRRLCVALCRYWRTRKFNSRTMRLLNRAFDWIGKVRLLCDILDHG